MAIAVRDFFRLIGNLIWSGLTIATRSLSGILVTKFIAMWFGAAGLAIFAHFQNLIVLFVQIPQEGINRGLITILAREEDRKQASGWFSMALMLTGACLLASFLLLLLGKSWFFRHLPTEELSVWLVLGGFAAMMLTFLFQSLLIARSKLIAYFLGSLLGSGAIVLAVWLSSSRVEAVTGSIAAWIFGLGLLGFFSLGFAYLFRVVPGLSSKLPEGGLLHFGQYLLMALISVLASRGIDFVVRDMALSQSGAVETGIWQGAVRLSEGYMLLFAGITSAVVYPRIAALLDEREALLRYLRQVFVLILPLAAICLLLIFLFRETWLELLLSSQLRVARVYVPGYVLADAFLIPSWLLAFTLLAARKTVHYLLLQAIPAIVYLSLVWLRLPGAGPEVIVEAYLVRALLFSLICGILSWRLLRKP